MTRTENLPRSKNAPQERFCPPEHPSVTANPRPAIERKTCGIFHNRTLPREKLFCPVTRRESPAPPCTGRGRPASAGAPWGGPRLCGPRPCSGSLHPPQAAVACAAIPVRRPKPHGYKEKHPAPLRAGCFGEALSSKIELFTSSRVTSWSPSL